MALFKCKMCGGTLEIGSESVAICEYCGTQQTLPRLDDDRRANLYDRANHFRRNNEFDKAMSIYEQILNEDSSDAEAYWSLVLCRYGIEYVEDPASHKRMPTVNRAQFTAIFDDDNYKSALQHADAAQRAVYEAEAKAINEIQKGILAISQQEEPFDVFICYKETDANGRRTPDSVLAQELYYQLTQEGFKVFFARITLEDKLGSAYEPYIFAALNSAKVMVVLGTRPEHFKAVWVRNEWSRYLALIKNGASKVLIPAYRDMDPYDLPDEFSHLQAQDMSKLGFMQDLIRGIKKIVGVEARQPAAAAPVASAPTAATAPLLKRAAIFLEDRAWSDARDYCEKVLDLDPECAQAYLYKLLSDLKLPTLEDLGHQTEPFDSNLNYQKAYRFGDEDLRNALTGYLSRVQENIKEEEYQHALRAMSKASFEPEYRRVSQLFSSLGEYKDSARLAEEYQEKAEISRKNALLANGRKCMEKRPEQIKHYQEALGYLMEIPGWKDADELAKSCQTRIHQIEVQQEELRQAEIKRARRARRRAKVKSFIGTTIFLLIILGVVGAILWEPFLLPVTHYLQATMYMKEGKAVEAYELIKDEELVFIADKADEIYPEYLKAKFETAQVGDIVTMGKCANPYTGIIDPMEWQVLDIQDGKVLILSTKILEYRGFHTLSSTADWESSSVREWLNGNFMTSNFTEQEISMFAATTNTYSNPQYNTPTGEAAIDQIFLLSAEEAEKYFANDMLRQASTLGADNPENLQTLTIDEYPSNEWWLRTIGSSDSAVAFVSESGEIFYSGQSCRNSCGVRPAIWIDITAIGGTAPTEATADASEALPTDTEETVAE